MASGGPRQGRPGKSYANRSDLNAAKPLPIQAPPSQHYGQATQLENMQRAVPMQAQPTLSAPAAASPPPGAPPAAPTLPPPPPPLDAPTSRPDEPIQAGLGQPAPGSLAATFQAAADASGSSALAVLAQRARQLGQ